MTVTNGIESSGLDTCRESRTTNKRRHELTPAPRRLTARVPLSQLDHSVASPGKDLRCRTEDEVSEGPNLGNTASVGRREAARPRHEQSKI